VPCCAAKRKNQKGEKEFPFGRFHIGEFGLIGVVCRGGGGGGDPGCHVASPGARGKRL